MIISSFFMLESTLWFKKNTNIITIVNQILGFKCKIIVVIIYTSLLYTLMSAYIFAYDKWLKKIISSHFYNKNIEIICFLFFFLLTMQISLNKEKSIDKLNYILSLILLASYIILIFICTPHINTDFLLTFNIKNSFNNLSLIITSFGFCIVIPNLVVHLNKDSKKILYSIIIGGIIPLIIYIIWQITILGIFPINNHDKLLILNANENNFDIMFIYTLEAEIKKIFLSKYILLFSIFAILTSYIGITISLNSFFYDEFIYHNKPNNIIIFILTIVPPILISIYFTSGFTIILKFSGIFVSILLGLLPTIIIWYGRYNLNIKGKFTVFGGKPLLLITLLFFLYVIIYNTYILLI